MRITLLLLAAGASCYAQVSARVSLSNGTQVTITTRSGTAEPVALKTSLEPASGDSFYRIFRDENNLAVFAYELEVARTADGSNFRITAKPATEAFATRFPNADGGKPTPTLSSPLESPLLGSGERFSIPIPSDPGLGQNLTDTVQILLGQRGTANDGATGSAQIRFAGLKVYIQGKSASPTGAGADVSGRYAMFYIPGRGGYFFSNEPVDGRPFVQGAVVDGKHMTLTIDNETYDCTATAPILVHAIAGNCGSITIPTTSRPATGLKPIPPAPRTNFSPRHPIRCSGGSSNSCGAGALAARRSDRGRHPRRLICA